ncbi:hypothetical protein SAMN05421504_101220 [Amycolatopsis xylanica]|uniref:Uncharacterized protein n=1 Tax=Amycolatopsis xylanica TaxID=589385 RepID=A0A1H2SH26_9PSEU|nr:hypothetical protein [Amycolatopsis xylanica]SDW30921.1 hypothetical protein SAMN05421504_101220 [Amycolatopsis xylanica]
MTELDVDWERAAGFDHEDEPPQHDAGLVWQPYADPPLVTSSMLMGLDAMADEERQRLFRYLAALVDARKTPVHVNVAFNAVYFGFDVTAGGYVHGALHELFSFPEIHVGEENDALPVGALVKITAGGRPFFAEVVYKEGAHPELQEDGSLPAWVSGAPAGAVGPGQANSDTRPLLSELLVIDTDAFGPGFSLKSSQVDRARRAGRAMNADGHLVYNARYASREDADLDEVSYYARYLLTRGRDQVMSASAPMSLGSLLTPDAGEEQYQAAVLGLLNTIRDALSRLDDQLRTWHGYAFGRAAFGARLTDDGPLGESDLGMIATQLGRSAVRDRPPRWAIQPKPAYLAIGPRLRQIQGAGQCLVGVGYAAAVCHANSVISDYVRRDSDESTGLLPGGISLRLDDHWQGGGVWRSAAPGGAEALLDITQPLGLGWSSTLPEVGPAAEPDFEDSADLLGAPTDLVVKDSEIAWTQPLRLKYLQEGSLPLPDGVAAAMRGVAPRLRLMLSHDGAELETCQQVQNTTTELYAPAPRLSEIDWPLEFFVGIVLTCSWTRGSSIVRATSTLLEEPVTVDGELYEHRFDRSILTREAAPGEGKRGSAKEGSSTSMAGALTLPERVLRAVRRLGLLDSDGRAVLTRTRLGVAVHGESTEPGLGDAIDELIRDGRLRADLAGVDELGLLRFPAEPGQREIEVLVYEPSVAVAKARPSTTSSPRTVEARFLRSTKVTGHVRRIGHLGRVASEEQKAAYRAEMERVGNGARELPPGFTFVTSFTRGR